MDLLDDDLNPIEPSIIKGSSWLLYFGHSNTLCAWASRAITNHALIGEYLLKFFPKKEFGYPCGKYPIETRQYILYKYQMFNNY